MKNVEELSAAVVDAAFHLHKDLGRREDAKARR